MQGRIEPAAALSSRTLAQRLGVSAQPVRDALKRLEADGVVDGRAQSGFHLRRVSKREYREILEIRLRLEGLAGRIAAAQADASDIEDLRRANADMSRAQNPTDRVVRNFEFHFALYSLARRDKLLQMIETLWVRIGPTLHYYSTSYEPSEAWRKHEVIISALVAGDADKVEAAIRADLKAAAPFVIERLPDEST